MECCLRHIIIVIHRYFCVDVFTYTVYNVELNRSEYNKLIACIGITIRLSCSAAMRYNWIVC